jgi:hypothetical protein
MVGNLHGKWSGWGKDEKAVVGKEKERGID